MNAPAPASRPAHRLGLARLALGAIHLAFPGLAGTALNGRPFGPTTRTVVRILGARHISQALATGRQPSPAMVALGAEVDAAHATSMIGLAIFDPRQRRAALASAAIATGFALAGLHAARAMRATRPPPYATPTSRRERAARRLARTLAPTFTDA